MKLQGFDLDSLFPEIDDEGGSVKDLIPVLLPLALIFAIRLLVRDMRLSGIIGMILILAAAAVYWQMIKQQPARIWVASGSWFNYSVSVSFLTCVTRMVTAKNNSQTLFIWLAEGLCALLLAAFLIYKKNTEFPDATVSCVACGFSAIFSWLAGNRYKFGIYHAKGISLTGEILVYGPMVILFVIALIRTFLVMKKYFTVNH